MRLLKATLDINEKRTFSLHLLYSIIEGVILGVLALNEFVFIKSLHGTEYQLSILFQFSVVVFVFLIFINEFLNRVKNKKLLLRLTALISRGPLALIYLFPSSHEAILSNPIYHLVFLAIFFNYFLGNTVIYPTINLFLKNNYKHQNFGYLYSFTQSINKIVLMLVTLTYGILLDGNNFVFREVFVLVSVLGILSIFLLSNINYTPKVIQQTHAGFFNAITESMKRMWRIITQNRPYLHFEIGFMLYGVAFMTTITVVNFFFHEELGLSYSSYAFYKNVYNILAIILLPFFGKLLGRLDPRKFAIITYLAMMFHLLFLVATEYYPYFWETPDLNLLGIHFPSIQLYPMLLISYLFYSVFAATMALLWFIGSAYFCKDEEAGDYQSTHLFLTGIRALFAPALGVFIYQQAGYSTTFAIGALALLIGAIVMVWSSKKRPL